MGEYIKREAVCDKFYQRVLSGEITSVEDTGEFLRKFPAADVAPVVPELRKAVNLLQKEYEKAKHNPIVRDPLAYALYQAWKAVEGKNGR